MPNTFKQVLVYIRKDWSLDWRKKFSLGGILLYIITCTFIVFLSFKEISPEAWNALFWIILLFGVVNGVVRSFQQESSSQKLYYFQLVDPYVVLFAKIVYNFLMTCLMALLTFGMLSIFSSMPVEDFPRFGLVIVIGSMALSVCFTFISSIATQAQQSTTLMAILGLPIIIPIMLLLVKLTRNSLGLVLEPEYGTDFMILGAISVILFALSLWLFPIIWKE